MYPGVLCSEYKMTGQAQKSSNPSKKPLGLNNKLCFVFITGNPSPKTGIPITVKRSTLTFYTTTSPSQRIYVSFDTALTAELVSCQIPGTQALHCIMVRIVTLNSSLHDQPRVGTEIKPQT
jgi:hypothetical protein